MKLVMAIINDEDAYSLMNALNERGYRVTKLASTGGFLRSGNTTLITGVEDDNIDDVVDTIEKTCKSRKQMMATNTSNSEGFAPYPIEVTIGGATIFVMDVMTFKKV